MRLPRSLARANRVVVNPIQNLWADRVAPYAVIEHAGRRTGAPYRTPVLAFPTDDGFTVLAFYGTDTDWLRNLEAGRGSVVARGQRHLVQRTEIVSGTTAAAVLSPPLEALRRALHIESVIRIVTTPALDH